MQHNNQNNSKNTYRNEDIICSCQQRRKGPQLQGSNNTYNTRTPQKLGGNGKKNTMEFAYIQLGHWRVQVLGMVALGHLEEVNKYQESFVKKDIQEQKLQGKLQKTYAP